MFGYGLEGTIIGTAVALWVAHAWYLDLRLKRVHAQLYLVLRNFDGLREYLYEIDPQFDEERFLFEDAMDSVENERVNFAPLHHMELIDKKKREGKRILKTPFVAPEETREILGIDGGGR